MKLRSPTDEPLHIALTSGHTLVIEADDAGTDVPQMFRREALSRGAVQPGEKIDADPLQPAGFDRKEVIRSAIEGMLDGGAEDDFTSDGKPNLRKLGARVGFTVSRDEVNAIWADVSKADDSDSAQG